MAIARLRRDTNIDKEATADGLLLLSKYVMLPQYYMGNIDFVLLH
ncbi:MAG: hypothetical protein PG981_000715 [Wolbachia endosymbiont of Ctenocephalides orientis wCori]|nr:MAG: hypothetical protein PG981_000715 [Wolbachia endosymbiont of Ctenocephalides orientis wCori]